MFNKTPFPSLLSFLTLIIGCGLFTMSTMITIHRLQDSKHWLSKNCLYWSRVTVGCGVAITFVFGLLSVLLASILSGKTRKKYFWGYRKNLCARILNGFFLLLTFLLTLSWLGIVCLTLLPLYGFLYIYFGACNGQHSTAARSFVNILNEINQHIHRTDEKPLSLTLPDICQSSVRLEDRPEKGLSIIDIELEISYRDYFLLSIVATVSSLVIIISLIFLMIAQGANHAHIFNDRARYEVAQQGDQDIEETKM